MALNSDLEVRATLEKPDRAHIYEFRISLKAVASTSKCYIQDASRTWTLKIKYSQVFQGPLSQLTRNPLRD